MISRGASALHACSAACTLYSTAADSNSSCLAFTYQLIEPDPVTREAANFEHASQLNVQIGDSAAHSPPRWIALMRSSPLGLR